MQKLSTLADDLWPYMVGKVQRVNRNGGGRVTVIGDTGSETLAGLTDVALGALSDGQLLAYEGSTGKWQNVDPAAGGGLTYTAGNGIAISGGNVISTKQKSGGGLFADSLGLTIVVNSESGLKLDSNGLAVGAGSGINVAGDLTAVHLGVHSGLNFDGAGGLVVDATLAGAGLGWDDVNKIMSVNVTEGLEYVGDSVRVDEEYAFIWEASHRFNATPQLNANLNFIGADRTITSAAGVDVTIDLGQDLILAAPMTFRSADYLDDIPISGFSLFPNTGGDRQLTINTIKSDSLHTRLFVADGVRIDIGEERWGKSMGIVHDDFFAPTLVGNTVYVFFEDSPMLGSAPLFSVNDWVLFRYLNQGSNFAFGSVWGQVTFYNDMGLDADGRGYQRWTFHLRHGDAGVLIKKGNVAVDYGASGQGFAFLSVLSDAVGPWFRIGTWSGANPFTAGNTQIRTQIGNLAGISDTALNPTGYGLYSDNAYLHGMLRTVETVLDDDGLAIEYQVDDNIDAGVHAQVSWWPDVAGRTGNPSARLAAWQSNADPSNLFDTVDLQVRKSDDSVASVIYLSTVDGTPNAASLIVDSRATIALHAASNIFYGNALPGTDITHDLGTTSLRWRNLYVDHLYVTGAISGDTLSGAEWEYPGSMIIDPHGAGDLTVSIINQGAGRADLSVDRNITLGGTIDGVDISAHVSDPSAHHAIASAGSGIVVAAGQIISVDATVVRTPATVLRTDQLLLTDSPLTGGGQLGDGLTLRLLLAAVNPGLTSATGGLGVDSTVARSTITITGAAPLGGGGDLTANRQITLTLATPSGLSTVGGLNVADTLAGNGLLMTAKVLSVDATKFVAVGLTLTAGAGLTGGGDLSANRTFDVVAGNGSLTVSADSMVVNQGFAFAWTGNQSWAGATTATFNAALTVNGIPTFNTAPRIDADLLFTTTDRAIYATANLTIAPTGDLVLNPSGRDVLPGGSGIINLGGYNRKWSTLYAAELYVETLVASNVMATIGGRVMITPTSSLIADFAIGATSIDLKHNSFTSGTWLYLENIAAGTPQSEAIKLSSGPTTITGGYRYTCTRGTGLPYLTGGPKNWVIGDAVVSLGAAVNDGYIDQASVQTIHSKIGPTITIYSRTATTNWNSIAPVVTMGNLNGFGGYASSLYGFAAGNDLTLSPASGFSGLAADATNGLRVFNTAYQLYSGANLILNIEKVNGISLEYGTAAFNSIGWYDDLGTGTPVRLRGSVGLSKTGSINSQMDILSVGNSIDAFTRGVIKLCGQNSVGMCYNVWIEDSGVFFGSQTSAASQTGGFIQDAKQYFSGAVGIGTTAPLWLQHNFGLVDGGKLIALSLHNNTNTNNSETAIRFINRSTLFTNEASRVGELAVSAGSGPSTIYGRVSDGTLVNAFSASSTNFTMLGALSVGAGAAITTSASVGTSLAVGTSLTAGGPVGFGTVSPLWLQHNFGLADGSKLIALALHNNSNTDNSETAIRFINRSTSFTNEANRVGELSVSGGGGAATIIGRVSDTAALVTAFTASAGRFYVPATLGLGLTDPDAPLTIVGLDATLANGANQIRLRSQRQTINTSFALIGGIDFMSNDTQLTHPGVVVAAIQAVATNTHNVTVLDTAVRVMTTLGTTYGEHSRFRGDGSYLVNGGINFGGTTFKNYDENTLVWSPTLTGSTGNPTGVTYSTRTGRYTRVGDCVFYLIVLNITVVTGGSGAARISLPIVPAALTHVGAARIVLGSGAATGIFQPQSGAAYGTLYTTANPGITIANLSGGLVCEMSGFYFI